MFWPLMKNTITTKDRLQMMKFIWSADRFTNGEKVLEFESRWSEWLGVNHSLFVSSGSTANFLLLAAAKEMYNWGRTTKVLVPACTWMTNVSPVIQLGMKPIFCDVNTNNYSFDEDDLRTIRSQHDKIDCVFLPHLLGFYGSFDAVKTIFPEAIILEDICESHGIKDGQGDRCGGKGLGSTFSFYYGHHMTTVEGGMVSTNNTDLFNLMKMKRSHGLAREALPKRYEKYAQENPSVNSKFLFMTDGYNFRNHEIPAVLGISQLRRLDEMISIRQENFDMFMNMMKKHEAHFHLPQKSMRNLNWNFIPSNSNYAFPLLVKKNQELREDLDHTLTANGIETRPIIAGNLLNHPAFRNYSLSSKKKQSNVDLINRNGLYIGNNHFIGKKHIDKLDSILTVFFNQ